MFKKTVAWCLIAAMLLQLGVFDSSFASDPPAPRPEITYKYFSDWGGFEAGVGDTELYLEVRGYSLSSLGSIVANLYENSSDTYATAFTTESAYLGINGDGEDVFILKLELQEDKALESISYYIEIIDEENDVTLTEKELFYIPNNHWPGSVEAVSIGEMADSLDTIYLETRVKDFKPGQTMEDFSIELVQGDVGYSEETTGSVSKVGAINLDTFVLDELENGSYSLKGEFTLLSGLDPNAPVFVKVVGPGKTDTTDTAYSYYHGISVLSTDSPEVRNFKISNAYKPMSYGHGQANAGLGTYYVSSNEDELSFSFNATAMSNSSMIDLKLKNNTTIIGELLTDTLELLSEDNGLFTVQGTVYAAVYSPIPNEANTIELYYDNELIEEGSLVFTTVRGVDAISYEGSYSHTLKPYPLYTTDSIEILLENALNLDTSLFSGQLINLDDYSTIDLDIDATKIDNNIALTLTPEIQPLGTYQLDIKHDGDDINQLYESSGELTEQDPILMYNSMTFDFTDDSRSVLKSIDNDNNTLYLNGKGFSSSKSYTAYFIKHVGSSLNAAPFELPISVNSSTSLRISKSAQEALPRGWYTVYVKENGEYIKGLVDVTLLKDSDSSSEVLPTVSINNGEEYTLVPEITINITPGSFSQMKLASSVEGLEAAPWQNIDSEIPYTLEGEYGDKTIYFVFKTSSGLEYSLNASITYRGELLDDMLAYGIIGSSEDSGAIYLHNQGSYTFYIQGGSRELTGYVEFLDEAGQILRTEVLKRTSGSALVHTYSKQIRIEDVMANTKTIRFYAMDNQSFSSNMEDIAVNIRDEAFISSYQSKLETKLLDKQYLLQGSQMSFTLKGASGFSGAVAISYIDVDNNPQTAQVSLNETAAEGVYEGSITLPANAMALVKFIYIIEDPYNPSNSASSQENKAIEVSSNARFTGLSNSSGDYNGKILTINSYYNWFYEDISIKNDESIFTIEGLQPSILYQYRLWDDNKVYKSGSFTTSKGETNEIDLGDAAQPANVTINLNGLDSQDKANVKIYYNMDAFPYTRYIESGESFTGFVIGDSITYGIELNDMSGKKYKAIGKQTKNVNNKNTIIDVDMELLETVRLTGAIIDARIPDQALDNVNINIQQQVNNGFYVFNYITNAVTNEEGEYSARVYPDTEMLIYFSKPGYVGQHQTLTISNNHTLDKNIELATQSRILVKPYARPLLNSGEEADDSQLLALDMYKIRSIQLETMDGKRTYAPFYRQSGYIDLTYANVAENQKLKIMVTFFDYQSEEEEYIVTLDPYKNAVLNAIAVPNGEIVADVASDSGDAAYSYMLLYDNTGRQVAYVESPDTINTKQMKIEAGNYLALFFKGMNLERLKDYKLWDSLELLELNENVEYIKKNVSIVNGRVTDLGKITIPQMLSPEKLGTSTTRITNRFIPNSSNGELRILAQISHSGLGDEKYFNSVVINTNGTLKPDSLYFDGVKKGGSPYSIGVSDGLKTENTLYFTIIPSSMEQTYLSLRLVYVENGSWVRETISLDNLNVPELTLIAPEEVFMGSAAKEVFIRGVSEAGSKIEIYSNDQLIGETTTPANKTSYQTTVELPNSSTPMVHLLYAKMITDDEELNSGYSICEVIDPDVMAYTSNFEFKNGYRTFTSESPSDSNQPITMSYNPGSPSEISFRINNLLEEDLDYVAFVNTYNGEDTYFDATHVRDVETSEYKYSEWRAMDRIGMPGEFSVYYSLSDNASLGPISGTKPIDFEAAINNSAIDPSYLPTSILESEGRSVTQNGENLSIVVPVGDTGYLRLDGSFRDNQLVSPEDLLEQGYVQINTLQGPYWTKESLEEIDGVTVYNRKMYFSPALTAIMKSEVSPIIGKSIGGPMVAQIGQSDALYALSSVDQALSTADYTGYVYNIADLTANTGGNSSGFGIGSKMQVLGGAVFVAQALSGPTSKDHNTLYQAAALIKDPMIRSRIGDDIRQYDRARRSSHTVSTILGGASYGAGFGGVVGKGLSYIISTGSMVYGKKTGAELDIWWDAIMRDIQNEINLQEFREKKGKKKPAKKDKIKKPKWKIDPSGYVFEAIESNRIEGITAYVLVGDMDVEDSFVIWDEAEEWEEINPDITDKDGKYGWDVPEGDWKVKFVGNDDYKTSYTQGMEVPPLHDQVNIGLLSKGSPEVIGVALDNAGLEIEFDSFMQLESIYNVEAEINNISIYDSSNTLVPCSTVEMVIGTEDTVYKESEENVYQADYIQAEDFTKRVRFVVDEALYPGGFKEFKDDGITVEEYRVVVSGNVQSYSGVRMDTDYQESSILVGEKQKLDLPSSTTPGGTYYEPQEINLLAIDGGTIYYTTDGTAPTTLSKVWKEPMYIDKTTTIKALVSKVGHEDSDIASFEYRIEKEPIAIVATPKANISSGTYSSSINVALSTATGAATIRYTLDGSIPTGSSSIYTSPIRISESKTLRAIAVKNDYIDSAIASFSYTIEASSGSDSDSDSGSGSGGWPVDKDPIEKAQIGYSDNTNTIEMTLRAMVGNNEALYSLSDEDISQLISTLSSDKADTIVLKLDEADTNIKTIIKLPISFIKEISSLAKAIKLQSRDYQLIINEATLKGLSSSEEESFELEVIKEKSNQLNIGIKKDNKDIELTKGGLIVAMPLSTAGAQWVFVENQGTPEEKILSYSFHNNGYVWGNVGKSTTLSLINNLKSFQDISGGWYEDSVIFVTSRELFRGTREDSFTPNLPMTRGMLATVLYKLSRSEAPTMATRDETSFEDVSPTAYYYDSINWAYSHGIISGMANGQFAPASDITREQLAVMLYNYSSSNNLLKPLQGIDSSGFSDSASISDWAKTAIDYAVQSGLMRGKGNNTLDPKGKATRAEVAAMLQSFIKLHNNYPK